MFTGLVESMVELIANRPEGPARRLTFDLSSLDGKPTLGESIAFNGCCLTVVGFEGMLADFEAGEETLSRTNLGRLVVGDRVNAERALRVGDRLGGHYVTGHIDGSGIVRERRDDGPWTFMHFQTSRPLMLQMASKGSIAIDGVSLTLVEVNDDSFSVALIPHTLERTTLGKLMVGSQVNLETDVLAKYVERQLGSFRQADHDLYGTQSE